ncbi:DNA-directed RNA polymerase subunit L [Candidatus Woesearchaeota archaeon]|nr:DNA-directed RNA polymerase subunit L [Candidatus Woesearchaeota archaeon]
MEVQFLIEEKNKVKVEIKGEGHTLCNPLVKELWKDDKVDIAGYSIDHSLVSNPFLTVEGSDAKNSLRKAIERLNKKAKDLDDKFKKAK